MGCPRGEVYEQEVVALGSKRVNIDDADGQGQDEIKKVDPSKRDSRARRALFSENAGLVVGNRQHK